MDVDGAGSGWCSLVRGQSGCCLAHSWEGQLRVPRPLRARRGAPEAPQSCLVTPGSRWAGAGGSGDRDRALPLQGRLLHPSRLPHRGSHHRQGPTAEHPSTPLGATELPLPTSKGQIRGSGPGGRGPPFPPVHAGPPEASLPGVHVGEEEEEDWGTPTRSQQEWATGPLRPSQPAPQIPSLSLWRGHSLGPQAPEPPSPKLAARGRAGRGSRRARLGLTRRPKLPRSRGTHRPGLRRRPRGAGSAVQAPLRLGLRLGLRPGSARGSGSAPARGGAGRGPPSPPPDSGTPPPPPP